MKQSKFSKIIIAVIFSVFFAGNSLAYVDVIEDAEESQYRLTTLGSNNAIANSPQVLIVEKCSVGIKRELQDVYVSDHTFEGEVLDGQEWVETKVLVNCQLLGNPIANSTTGYITGISGPVINGAAVTGGAYLLGKGIAHSGDNTNVNNDSSSKSKGGKGGLGGQGGDGGAGGSGGSSVNCHGRCSPTINSAP